MKVDRNRIKACLIAQIQLEIETLPNDIRYLPNAIALGAKGKNIAMTPAKVISPKGKIDKRRYRRFVTKHKPERTLRINGT